MTKILVEGRHMKPSSRSRFKKLALSLILSIYVVVA